MTTVQLPNRTILTATEDCLWSCEDNLMEDLANQFFPIVSTPSDPNSSRTAAMRMQAELGATILDPGEDESEPGVIY